MTEKEFKKLFANAYKKIDQNVANEELKTKKSSKKNIKKTKNNNKQLDEKTIISKNQIEKNEKVASKDLAKTFKTTTQTELFQNELQTEKEENLKEKKQTRKIGKNFYNLVKVEQLPNNKILEVKNLHVSFPAGWKKTIHIVRGIDLDVYQGQIVGLVGESGSGKSVTSKTLINVNQNGIITADKIQIDDLELTKIKKASQWQYIRGKKIGYIPQDPLTSLNPTRTIGKQLLDALNTNEAAKKQSYTEKREYLIGLLKQFGLRQAEKIFKSYPHTLSGGMKQRVVITMVVALKPDVIIADEPTTALDPTVQASVLSLFEDIRQKFDISIVLISHNISVIAKFCDYIYVMYAGRIVERGTKKEIFTEPKHPYTWALISAIPESKDEKLYNIKGTPPDMANLPLGDPFAPRNDYALEIDFIKEPPLIPITKTHSAATWLLHPDAPKVTLSKDLVKRLELFKKAFNQNE